MRQTILDGIVKPGAAILFLLGFGLPLVFFGFQSVEISAERTSPTSARVTMVRTHLLGLVERRQTIDDVTRAVVEPNRSPVQSELKRLSTPTLISGERGTPIFVGSTNLSGELKHQAARELNAFLAQPQQGTYRGSFEMRSAFGWVGLPFVVLGLYGLIRWPGLLASAWRQDRHGHRPGKGGGR